MGKGNRAIIIAIALLVLIIGVLAYLNAGDLDRKKELESNAEFALIHGEATQRVTMEDLRALDPVDFTTVMRTSTTGHTDVTFTGVELRALLEKYNVELQAQSTIEAKALDGYASALAGEEVLAEANVYITIAMDGEPLKPKNEGGFGPYFLVIRNTEFAQRWVKFLEEITVR